MLLWLGLVTAPGPAVAANCVDDCKRRLQARIGNCNLLFEDKDSAYYRNTRWHGECVSRARADFDSCRSSC